MKDAVPRIRKLKDSTDIDVKMNAKVGSAGQARRPRGNVIKCSFEFRSLSF